MSFTQNEASLIAASPGEGWKAFALAAFAVLLVVGLVEGGPWAWIALIATVAAVLVAPLLLREPWRMICILVVPVILTGGLWTFSVGTGTRITPSLVVVSVCMAILSVGVLRQTKIRRLPLIIPFSIYWIAVALSGIPAVSKLHWVRGLIEVTLGYGFFVFGYVYVQNREQVHSLLKIFLALGVATVVFALLQHWLLDYIHGLLPLLYDENGATWVDHWYGAGRVVGNWEHPSNLGSIINLTGPIALYYFLETEKFELKYLLAYATLGMGVVMTSTRTPMVAFALSSLLLVVLLRRRISRLMLPFAVFLALAIATPFVFLSLGRFDLSTAENEVTVEGRAAVRLEAYLLFLQNPILGVGARNYQDRVFFSDPNLQGAVHNAFVEHAAETGVVGVASFICLLYVAFRGDFRRRQKLTTDLRDLCWVLFAACVAIVIESLAENSLYVWQVACLFWLFRGISLAIRTEEAQFATAAGSVV